MTNSKLSAKTPKFLVMMVLFLAIFSGFTLILILLNRNIMVDQNNVDIFKLYIRASFILIGSTLSGIVALYIFTLQEKSKQREKEEKEQINFENMKEEFEENLEVAEKLYKLINDMSPDTVADDLHSDTDIKETFLATYTQLNYTYYNEFLKDINVKRYRNQMAAFKMSYQIYKYLDLILNKLENKENTKKILEIIKRDIAKMKSIYYDH